MSLAAESENASTEKAILEISNAFDPTGAIALVCVLENQNLFSGIDLRGKDVLEIGCGCLPACFGIPDREMPRRYVATDTTSALIEAAMRVDSRPEYKVESALRPSFEDGTFDLLVLRGVLHHLEDPTSAMVGFERVVKPGGKILIYEPNLSSLPGNAVKWILLKFFNINMEESPYGQLPRRSILQSIEDSGFLLRREWYSSLFAFQLTGDYGRRPVLPNSKPLFRAIVALERLASSVLHRAPLLARWLHWRVVFLAEKRAAG